MIDAVRGQTILASALPDLPLAVPDEPLLLEGATVARAEGLPRALFCVRLTEQAGGRTSHGRLSFLVGAFVGAELDRLQATGALPPRTPVSCSGMSTCTFS